MICMKAVEQDRLSSFPQALFLNFHVKMSRQCLQMENGRQMKNKAMDMNSGPRKTNIGLLLWKQLSLRQG